MRRVLVVVLAALLLALCAGVARVQHDRRQCPPGPWAHPLDRLKGGSHGYNVACVRD